MPRCFIIDATVIRRVRAAIYSDSLAHCPHSSVFLLGTCLGLVVLLVLGLLVSYFIVHGFSERAVVGLALFWFASGVLAASPASYARFYCWLVRIVFLVAAALSLRCGRRSR